VNNEIYNCQGDGVIVTTPSALGNIIENNDIYITTAYYSDGSGNLTPSGEYACAENAIDLKGGGTSGNPLIVLQNRAWGFRWTDGNCADGSGGDAIIFHGTGNAYGIIQNNIMLDGTTAITAPNPDPSRYSLIGNMIYDMTHSPYAPPQYAIRISSYATTSEVYFNTIIQATNALAAGTSGGHDLRCNVIISSGVSAGSASQYEYNVYYGTPDSGETYPSGNYPLNSRANSTAYSLNDIIRTTATPPADGTAGDFLYKVTVAGTSAGSPPSYTTILGGTNADGTMTVRAIRGPYSFYRKLRTTPEIVYIPYTNRDTAAPEVGNCPSGFASRTGIGIDDTQP